MFVERVREHFPSIEPITCQDPIQALTMIDNSLDLLIIDLEMPKLDGKKVLSFAIGLGLDKKKIMIISSRDTDYLHEIIPLGQCLCVLNKHDARQLSLTNTVKVRCSFWRISSQNCSWRCWNRCPMPV